MNKGRITSRSPHGALSTSTATVTTSAGYKFAIQHTHTRCCITAYAETICDYSQMLMIIHVVMNYTLCQEKRRHAIFKFWKSVSSGQS